MMMVVMMMMMVMMMWMWMLRRRGKMMMLRRMMLRKKTDSKTGKHTLCEPAQSKCTWTSDKSNFVEIYRKNAGPQSRARHFVRACAIEMHTDISQEPFCVEIYR